MTGASLIPVDATVRGAPKRAPRAIKLTEGELEDLLKRAAEVGAKSALASIGLGDEKAGPDVIALREILKSWRSARSIIAKEMLKQIGSGVMILLAAGAAYLILQNRGQ